MPTLNKSKRRFSNYKKHDINADISKIYNTSQWRKLRMAQLMRHPLCEMCESKGRTTLASCVHHIKYISSGKDELEMRAIAFDPFNLMSLCDKCHHEIHNNTKYEKKD